MNGIARTLAYNDDYQKTEQFAEATRTSLKELPGSRRGRTSPTTPGTPRRATRGVCPVNEEEPTLS